MTGGSGHSSLCLGLVAVVVVLWPGVEARLDWEPELLLIRRREIDWIVKGKREKFDDDSGYDKYW